MQIQRQYIFGPLGARCVNISYNSYINTYKVDSVTAISAINLLPGYTSLVFYTGMVYVITIVYLINQLYEENDFGCVYVIVVCRYWLQKRSC